MLRFYKPDDMVRMSAKQWGIPAEYMPLFTEDLRHSVSEDFNRTLIEALAKQQLPEKLNGPLLALVGEKETVPAKQAARKLAGLYPQASGRMVPGLGHVWAMQNPQLFADTVRAWVCGAPLPASLRPLA
jgi:pimeloyl-ACP methyl ester carboxylesterase